ncbi:hypothetical protein Tco_1415135, partial [Tanacetum coccineum]
MRTDELHKFSDGTLNHVRITLNDIATGIHMEYLPKRKWNKQDKQRARVMINSIDKKLRDRRLMRSLEKFVKSHKMDSMHFTLSMYYDYGAHVKGELLVMMKNSQSVNLLIFISNTLIELFNDFGFDCDGIPKRPTMYLNLWSYKVVRHKYSNPMIQPKPEGSTQGYPLDSVEVLVRFQKGRKVKIRYNTTEMELVLEQTQQGTSYEVSVSTEGVEELKRIVRIKFDESNTYVLERFDTSAGNPVKEILLKLNLPDHRILKDGGE